MDMNDVQPLLLPQIVFSEHTATRAGVVMTIADPTQWSQFTKLLSLCNGHLSTPQIAAELAMDVQAISEILTDLEASGFVWLLPAYTDIPTSVFQRDFSRWLPVWVTQMYDQPFWQGLYDGTVPGAVLIGWAMENMHYTRTVMSHMPMAVCHADSAMSEVTQFKHLSEEWDHYYMFMDGCMAAGVPADALSRSQPLASTQNITWFMRRVAHEGTIVYNACEALLEATTANSQTVIDFYERAGHTLGLPRAFTAELIRHVSVDKDFEHIDIFDHLLQGTPSLPSEVVVKIFSACQSLADLFVLWNTDIHDFYSNVL